MNDEKALALVEPEKPEETPMRDLFSLMPKTFEGAQQFCEVLAKSELVPKDYHDKAANIFVAIQCGAEIGLSPMQSIQSIAVINGRPCVWGDAVLALVQGSGKMEWIKEWDEGDTAYCETKRRGYPASYKTSFSDADAKAAGLLNKPGPWTQYKPRMRKMRARGFNLRDQYADVLKGTSVAEEIMDITPIEPTQPEPQKPVTQEEKGASVRGKMLAKSGKPKETDATTEEPSPTCMTEQEAASMLNGTTTVEDCQAVWTDLFKTFVKDQPKEVKARLSKVYTDRCEALGK